MTKNRRIRAGLLAAVLLGPLLTAEATVALAQASSGATVALQAPAPDGLAPAASIRPKTRSLPAGSPATPTDASADAAASPAPAPQTAPDAAAAQPTPQKKAKPPRDPSKGAVTNLPIPRYVSLKGNEGNARRGPSLTHRIDWVFTTAGTPLRVTAEHENWRRVEDAEGMGGWVHYALLSGVRTALVTAPMADFRMQPDERATVLFQAERGVTGRLLECQPDWCRVNVQGEKGWVQKTALWGVDPGEVLE